MKINKSGIDWFINEFDPDVLIQYLEKCVSLQGQIAAARSDAARLNELLNHLSVEDGLPDGSISALTNAAWVAQQQAWGLECEAKATINEIVNRTNWTDYLYYWEQVEFAREVQFLRQQQADRQGDVFI